MKVCLAVFIHEIKKLVLDKKMLSSMLLFPLMSVVLVAFMSYMENDSGSEEQKYYNIYFLGQQMEEQVEEYSENTSIRICGVNGASAEEFIHSEDFQNTDVLVEITDKKTILYYNSTDNIAASLSLIAEAMVRERHQTAILSYYDTQGMGTVNVTDIGEDKNVQNVMLALFLPYMLVLLLFNNVSNYTCDTIAGEKERGAFGKILLAPVSASSIIGGKILSSTLCGIVSSTVYMGMLIGGSAVCKQLGKKDLFGFAEIKITFGEVSLIFIYALLLCLLFATIAVLCSLYAKTAKEARSMLLPFMGVSMLLALFSMLRVGTVAKAMYMIPIYNICLVFQDILNAAANMENMILVAGTLLVCVFVALMAAVVSFDKENVRC